VGAGAVVLEAQRGGAGGLEMAPWVLSARRRQAGGDSDAGAGPFLETARRRRGREGPSREASQDSSSRRPLETARHDGAGVRER